MSEDDPALIRAAKAEGLPEFEFRHPLNPKSEVYLRSLSAYVGLKRIGLAEIDDKTYEVAPGDFMLFTAPSVGHHLRNPFETDLVYLMGGENREVEIGEFPRLKKRAIFEKSSAAYIVDVESVVPFGSES